MEHPTNAGLVQALNRLGKLLRSAVILVQKENVVPQRIDRGDSGNAALAQISAEQAARLAKLINEFFAPADQ